MRSGRFAAELHQLCVSEGFAAHWALGDAQAPQALFRDDVPAGHGHHEAVVALDLLQSHGADEARHRVPRQPLLLQLPLTEVRVGREVHREDVLFVCAWVHVCVWERERRRRRREGEDEERGCDGREDF